MILIKTLKNYKISVNFFLPGRKNIIFLNKMFGIYPDEKTEQRVHFYSVQDASEKTGIPPEDIDKALKQKSDCRYFSQKDKKVFWIRRTYHQDKRFAQIDNEEFPDVNSIMVKFGLSRDDVIHQLCHEKIFFHLPDSRFVPMYKYPLLESLIYAREKAKKLEAHLARLPPKIYEKAEDLVEEIEKLF